MEHTYLNYNEANLYSECVQHFMKHQDIASEQMVVKYINEHAPENMTEAQINKVLNVSIVALFSDNTQKEDFKFNAFHA